ncbi:b(0,+)-type amino acid transporter 1-like isoform X2 [Dermacentor albipictus]|uniref:b(0,+)-type amino acid transporter 1-like isoform X2 n=1 Tax=Dermacentor albipictus TaxID=60249 RepID=UPI0038FD0A91
MCGNEQESTHGRLRRGMGLFSAVAVVVGSCIGSGIFITPGIVYEDSGSVGVDLLIWVTAGVASLIHGLCYAELGTMLPSAGGPHEYLRVGLQFMGRTGDFLSFLCAWSFLVVDPIAVTIQGLTFTAYALSLPYGNCAPPRAVTILVTVVIVELAAVVNTFSLQISMKVQNVLFMVKLGVLFAIIATGVVWCIKAPYLLRKFTFATNASPGSVLQAFIVAMYTGSGSSMISCMAEEMSKPSRTIPRSLLGGIFVVTALQILTNAAYFVVLDHKSFTSSTATAVTFGRVTWGQAGEWLVPIAVCVCTFGTMSASSFSSSRLIMAAARKGHLPALFSLITARSSLPVIAIAFKTCAAVAFSVIVSVGLLAKCAIVIASAINILVMFSLLRLRVTMKEHVRPIRAPTLLVIIYIPILLSMALTPFTGGTGTQLILPTLAFILLGFPAYALVKFSHKSRLGEACYKFLQKCVLCVPCAEALKQNQNIPGEI